MALGAVTKSRSGVPRKCLLSVGYFGYNDRSSRDHARSDNPRGLAGAVGLLALERSRRGVQSSCWGLGGMGIMKREVIGCALFVMTVAASPSWARPPYLEAWLVEYPTSTIPDRFDATVQSGRCSICHHLDVPGEDGTNCYRDTLHGLLDQGMSIEEALDAADALDSDGDGVANGVEILMPRDDLPGDVGYAPGYVGPMGTDPCFSDPAAAVTEQLETPPEPVPAASTWGLVVMLLSLMVGGTVMLGRRAVPVAVVARRRS